MSNEHLQRPAPSAAVVDFITKPDSFRELDLEQQLTVIADLVLHYAELKVWALETSGKTRVDSCIEAQKYYAREKYWENVNMNLKKIADIRARGL